MILPGVREYGRMFPFTNDMAKVIARAVDDAIKCLPPGAFFELKQDRQTQVVTWYSNTDLTEGFRTPEVG